MGEGEFMGRSGGECSGNVVRVKRGSGGYAGHGDGVVMGVGLGKWVVCAGGRAQYPRVKPRQKLWRMTLH